MPTAAFTTLGCKVNQYETQRILADFEAAGFEVVPFDAAADVYVVNTCSVTAIAESKSRYTLRRARRTNPDAKVVVTGCAAQMALNQKSAIDGADLVVANPEKLKTLERFREAFPGAIPIGDQPRQKTDPFGGRSRATVKVQDGCSVCCSYCSIPHTRPGLQSRPASEVLEEIRCLADLGYREVILTGVLIGAYGPESGSGGPDFEELVSLVARVAGIERVRISSIEMRQVTDRLIGLIKDGLVVPHLHIPLQSGDSGVLSDMNRPYSQSDYLGLCERLYRAIPDLTLTTDIMVGFPTETEVRFQSTLDVVKEARFFRVHAFRFSPRPGTLADQWGDPVSDKEKQDRVSRLNGAAAETGARHATRFVGRVLSALVESKPDKDGLLIGLTDNYLEVRFAGPSTLARRIVDVRIDEVHGVHAFGERVAKAGDPSVFSLRPLLQVEPVICP
ncbi:MAG: Threonylcarbamoyladenosine tRNA methylthiotransferase MtaB [Fimbriimonadaceae bacterium]|nr:Threonylcarbamoyladenosine tRNA methylthiotransferase MtaB [Fimbriimonadaceae bacterium]